MTSISAALRGVERPDFADVQIVPVDAASPASATQWVDRIFSLGSAPWWVTALFGLRALLVPFIGLRQSREREQRPFAVSEGVDGEALVVTRAPHLDFRLGVVERDALLYATTVVTFNNWRGRLYFVPVGVLHGPVLRAMMVKAVRRASSRR